ARVAPPKGPSPQKPKAATVSQTPPNQSAGSAVVRSCAVKGAMRASIDLTANIGNAASTRSIVFRTAAVTGLVSVVVRIRKVGLFTRDGRCAADKKKRRSTSPRRLWVRAFLATPTT